MSAFTMCRCLFRAATSLIAVVALITSAQAARKKKNEEPKPQVLPLPKQLPRVLPADTRTLSFRTTSLLKSGRLSAQIHETLNELARDTRGDSIVKLRAFVAGAGDSRRVQEIVGDMFTEKKLALPVLTIVQVGGLGNEASAVVMEVVVSGRRAVNPNGLAFFSGEAANSLDAAVALIQQRAQSAGVAPADMLRATCFTARLTDYTGMRATLAAAFPQAALNLVQAQRDPADSRTTCEAVGRLTSAGTEATRNLPPGARVSFVTGPQTVFTGLQLSFGTYLDDADSALSRLQRDVQALNSNLGSAVCVNAFALNPAAASALQKTITKFNLPPGTLTVQQVEGLPSLDAALGMEAVLAPAQNALNTGQLTARER